MKQIELPDPNAIYYISHSAGKDSQAMYAILSRVIPSNQIVVVHADLGKIEWDGVQEHITRNISHPLNVVRANKTFFDMVRHRAKTRPDVPSFPSSAHRQCTSDLKRNPIAKFIRNDMKQRGATVAYNCVGIRAEESPARSKKQELRLNVPLSKAGRTVYDWYPIFKLSTSQVFETIKKAGQKPFYAYQRGNKRLSCVFCIMGCEGDLKNGRRHRPELYAEYRALEIETGWTMFPKQSLEDRTTEPDTRQTQLTLEVNQCTL